MKPVYKVILALLLILAAGVFQQSTFSSLSIMGVRPNFLLAIAAPLCMLSTPTGCILIGFFSGLIQGGLSGANLSAYLASYTLACFVLSFVTHLEIEINSIVAGFFSSLMALIAQVILLLLAPPQLILNSIGSAVGSSLYGGVISLVVYALLLKAFHPRAAWQ